MPTLLRAIAFVLTFGLCACASVERGRYGVHSFEFSGVEKMDDGALKACLITRERPSMQLLLGVSAPTCGEEPFDSSAPALRLWRWPWTEWPSFNRAVFDQDLERVLRFYRARGFYDAKVKEVSFHPPEAADPSLKGDCDVDRDDCTVDILVVIDEGEPVLIDRLTLEGGGGFSASLLAELSEALKLAKNTRFDEAVYDATKRELVQVMKQAGYAGAKVGGAVRIDTKRRRAEVTLRLEPGPLYYFGTLRVSGQRSLSVAPIAAAAALETGALYDPAVLREIQAEVFALGAFSAVEVREELDEQERRVQLEVNVTPLAPEQRRVGLGVQSGANRRTETGELESIPQWDLHVFGLYERRHLFGTLGKLRLEERPRLIFGQEFPHIVSPAAGNVLGVRVNQPGLVEPRTDVFTRSVWDYGPDPFLGFTRSDLFVRVGMRRGFFSRRLQATLSLQQDFFTVPRDGNATSDGSELPSSYRYSFVEQDARLDLRDRPLRPRSGAYLGLTGSAAPRWAGSDWTAFFVRPEIRGYLPLPFDTVLAARALIGSLFIVDASTDLDETNQRLGPAAYRLRGGGANSNRGFLAGQLGAGLEGGLRRWESTLELRLALGASFSVAFFADVGDVNDAPRFRFDHINLSAGAGLRFFTLIGALRLDAGFRIRSLQRLDGESGIEDDDSRFPFTSVPGALHFTIGESF